MYLWTASLKQNIFFLHRACTCKNETMLGFTVNKAANHSKHYS